MNAHRQHYHQANGLPVHARPSSATATQLLQVLGAVVVLLVAWAGLAALSHLQVQLHAATQDPVATARVEGFRAGYAQATRNACQAPALAPPIAPATAVQAAAR